MSHVYSTRDRIVRQYLVEEDDLWYVLPVSRDGQVSPYLGPFACPDDAVNEACRRHGLCAVQPRDPVVTWWTAALYCAVLLGFIGWAVAR